MSGIATARETLDKIGFLDIDVDPTLDLVEEIEKLKKEKNVKDKNFDINLYLGYLFENGKYLNKNKQKSLEYYIKSARSGNKIAQHSVSIKMYKKGDIKKALKWAWLA